MILQPKPVSEATNLWQDKMYLIFRSYILVFKTNHFGFRNVAHNYPNLQQ